MGLLASTTQGIVSILQVNQVHSALKILEIERKKNTFNQRRDLERIEFEFTLTSKSVNLEFLFDLDSK